MEIELRLILLIAGLVILCIVGMDLYNRRRLAQQNANNRAMHEPLVAETANDILDVDPMEYTATIDTDIAAEPMSYELTQPDLIETNPELYQPELYQEVEAKPRQQNIICINIMARDPYGFNGQELLNAIKRANLYFGRCDIFHRHENEDGSGNIIFSMVSAIEPGYFFLDTMPQEHVPGVTLFMLPEQLANAAGVFDKMVRIAKQMAFALNGELLDHERQPLTLTAIDRYRIQVNRR